MALYVNMCLVIRYYKTAKRNGNIFYKQLHETFEVYFIFLNDAKQIIQL